MGHGAQVKRKDLNMANAVIENGAYEKLTASAVVRTGPWQMLGLFVSSASSTPTIEILDATTSGTATCVAVFTPVAGTWYPIPVSGGTGLTVLISGTVATTLSWIPMPAGSSN